MPAIPLPLGVAPLAIRAAASTSTALTSASGTAPLARETNYVAYTHKEIHGSRIWTWDGRSGISLIFIVAFLVGLLVLFFGLIGLSRILAHTRAPSAEAVLPFRRPGLRPGDGMSAPHLRHTSLGNDSPIDPLPVPKAMYARTPGGSSSGSPASSSVFAEPLLAAAAPLGGQDFAQYRPNPRRSSKRSSLRPKEGPPPATNPRRNSRYTRAAKVELQRSRSRESSYISVDEPLDAGGRSRNAASGGNRLNRAGSGIRRVDSIGRGNSLRYSRSHEPDDDSQADLGRKYSARLAARSGRSHSQRRSRQADRLSREIYHYRDDPNATTDDDDSAPYYHYQQPYRDDDSVYKSHHPSPSIGQNEQLPLEGLSNSGRRGWGYVTPEAPSPL